MKVAPKAMKHLGCTLRTFFRDMRIQRFFLFSLSHSMQGAGGLMVAVEANSA